LLELVGSEGVISELVIPVLTDQSDDVWLVHSSDDSVEFCETLLCDELDSSEELGVEAGTDIPEEFEAFVSPVFFSVTTKTTAQIARIKIAITIYMTITASGTSGLPRHSCGRLLLGMFLGFRGFRGLFAPI